MKMRQYSPSRMIFEEKSLGFDRLIMLCDGIFAIAMTLLVLDIKLPEGVQAGALHEELGNLLTKSIFYLITFITVAGYWVSHRQLMTYIKRQDGPFTTLTFLFLAFVVFFPASFNVLVTTGNPAEVVIFYTLVLVGCGLSSFLLWAYASWKHRLIDAAISQHEIITRCIRILIMPIYFCLSLILLTIPHIDANAVFYSWFLLPIVARIAHVISDRIEKRLTRHHTMAPTKPESKTPVSGE
ncbi:TMEM175 family protein [Ktedonobacter racemifer]|uniref:Integral membrane protein n=1 Tax=Ktedonobacter racemifer DSM 44963 TaxID=485913 RepID=D6TVY1_KTERA|nr:TMEM175 family protein [Ktedonobacter racemifer]EFH84364.1 protein of unknown function DUF1211 [Ktedonobacter racemifer DSM 44963]